MGVGGAQRTTYNWIRSYWDPPVWVCMLLTKLFPKSYSDFGTVISCSGGGDWGWRWYPNGTAAGTQGLASLPEWWWWLSAGLGRPGATFRMSLQSQFVLRSAAQVFAQKNSCGSLGRKNDLVLLPNSGLRPTTLGSAAVTHIGPYHLRPQS